MSNQANQPYPQKFPNIPYIQLGRTPYWVSNAGFGTYRVSEHHPEHIEALQYALTHGINLIDTSSNYTNGNAEQTIGKVVQDLIEKKVMIRSDIIIVSKGGYIQGDVYQESQDRQQNGTPFPETLHIDDGLEHCIHPTFLEDQITKSLARLQLNKIDIYLLHNPEYFLSAPEFNTTPIEKRQALYYDRIKQAFIYLEKEVEKGRIGYYGISSNTFPIPDTDPTHTALSEVIKIAESISASHHFGVVQCPMNLIETDAITTDSAPYQQSFLEDAKNYNLGVLINRPFNAIYNHQLVRLTDTNNPDPSSPEEIEEILMALSDQEAALLTELESIETTPEYYEQVKTCVQISPLIQDVLTQKCTIEQWKEILTHLMTPRLHVLTHDIIKESSPPELTQKCQQFLSTANTCFHTLTSHLKQDKQTQLNTMKSMVSNCIPNTDLDMQTHPLSQICLQLYRSTPGIHCILIGMRHIHYVQDTLDALSHPINDETTKETWQRIRSIFRSEKQ